MCDRVKLENGGTLMFVHDCSKKSKMSSKTADDYPNALEYVSDCFKT